MDWSDRRAFLKSIGPMRVGALLAGVFAVSHCVERIRRLQFTRIPFESFDSPGDWTILALPVVALIGLSIGAYMCWLRWKCADAIAAVVGGRNPSMRDWSALHLRLSWLFAVSFAFLVLSKFIGFWLEIIVRRNSY